MNKIVITVVVTALFLQTGFLSGAPVRAQGESLIPGPSPTGSPTGALGEGESEPSATPHSSETPVPSETPTASETPIPSETSIPILGTPAPSETAEGIVLSLRAEPPFVKPGGRVNVFWQVEGVEKLEEGAFLRFRASPGLSLQGEEAKADEENGTIDLLISSVRGKVFWQAEETIPLPGWILAEFWQAGEAQAKAEIELRGQEEFAIEASGGRAEGLNGRVRVTFLPGALVEKVKVKIAEPSAEALPVQSLSGAPFEVTAESEATKAEVRRFEKPVEIQVVYSEAGMSDEANTRLFWYDPADGEWKLPLSQSIDVENNIITALTDHFTVFDTYSSGWQSAETPTMSFFQHSAFTGAATFSMPIKVPPGPGGFQPSLSLSYNSQVVDSATTETQASWVGMGWSLDAAAYIERVGNGKLSDIIWNTTDDDTYNLTLQGMSGTLWLGTDGQYHLENENFARITYNETTDDWLVLDKQGNRYYFDENVGYYDGVALTWRWMLSRAVNIYGQEITYTYYKEGQYGVHNFVYPDTILYAHGRYRVRFQRTDRYDYRPEWKNLYLEGIYKVFQKSLLESIFVEQDANGDGTFETVIRKYQFNYCASEACSIFPKYLWPSNQIGTYRRTSTLVSVQEFGVGGTQGLPPYTFEYGDGMHLTKAHNGYGGSVTFTYDTWHENIPVETWEDNWTDPDLPRWGNPLKCYFDESTCGWKPATVYTGIVTGGTSGYIRVMGAVKMPVQSYQPGRWYKMVARVKAANTIGAHTIQLGYSYRVNNVQHDEFWGPIALTTDFVTIASEPFFLDQDAFATYPYDAFAARMNSVGYTEVDWYYLVPLPTYARVASRTLSTGNDSYTFSYDYVDPAMNFEGNSDAVQTTYPYSPAYSEFRGHALVIETDPYGKRTETAFGQTDCLSGRTLETAIKDAAGHPLQSTSATYACDETESPQVVLDTEYPHEDEPFTGIYYRWARTGAETKTVYDASDAEAASLLTEYEYEPVYGNQVSKTVSGTGIETTVTHTDYFPNTSGDLWLVGLPARISVTDGGGQTLAETLNLYDGANTFNTAPTVGKLTATRTLISGTQYSQTSMAYDIYGNVTAQTTWTGYGTASTAPTEGAQTSYTCYGGGGSIGGTACPDDGYHTYALWMKNAKGHVSNVTYDYSLGLPTSATDPNGAVTSATYDNFGRFTSLTKPGDTSPSLNVSYQNSPFVVTLTQAIDATHTFTVVRNYDGMGRQTSTVTNGVTVASTFNAYGKPLTQSMPHATGAWFYSTTEYDAQGRPLTVTAPDGSTTSYEYNGLSTSVTDDKNHTHTTVTDILGRTLSVTPPTGPEVTFTYDSIGNMLTASRGGATMALKYDNAGRKLGMDDPDLGTEGSLIDNIWGWDYQYDALGNLTSQTDARGCITNIAYDELNRPTGKTYSNCPSTPNVTYVYDQGANGKGRRTSMSITGVDFTQWTYDARGRVMSESKQITGGGQFVTSFTYNSADLPVTMTYPDGEVVNFTYNNNMLPTSVSGTDAYAQSIAYDSANRMIQLVRGANKINTAYTYNAWNQEGGRLQNLTSTRVADGSSLQNLTYDYDSVGNINTITDSLAGPQTQTFTYDELDRLLSSSVTGGTDGLYTEGYSYDSATGNLASKNNVNYTAYDANHKHAVTSLSNGNSYGYDQNGNMTSRHVLEGTEFKDYTLNYDAENRLVSVSGNATANFSYDGDGKQVKATVNGVTAVYVGNHYEVKNSVVSKYYFAGATRLAVRTNGTLSFLLGDHLGSSSVTTNANGVKTASALYKAFGETRFSTGNLGTDYKFTNQKEESSLGLYFFKARFYDPSIGRFISADSITFRPPKNSESAQAFVALTVDFHETGLLNYVNEQNRKKLKEMSEQAKPQTNQSNKSNASNNSDNSQLEPYNQNNPYLTYSADKAMETLGLPSRIGRAQDNGEGSEPKREKEENASIIRPLQTDLIFSNVLDRYSYARGCPTRYTDPSGHECTDAQLFAVAFLIVAADLTVGLPLAIVIIMTGVVSPVAIAAEIGEGVIVAINIAAIVWVANGCPPIGSGKKNAHFFLKS